jgi:hypothetical protein
MSGSVGSFSDMNSSPSYAEVEQILSILASIKAIELAYERALNTAEEQRARNTQETQKENKQQRDLTESVVKEVELYIIYANNLMEKYNVELSTEQLTVTSLQKVPRYEIAQIYEKARQAHANIEKLETTINDLRYAIRLQQQTVIFGFVAIIIIVLVLAGIMLFQAKEQERQQIADATIQARSSFITETAIMQAVMTDTQVPIQTMTTAYWSSIDISGRWVGLFWRCGGNAEVYTIELDQRDREISGVSIVGEGNDTTILELRGTFENGILEYSETYVSGDVNNWSRAKEPSLELSSDHSGLQGEWADATCGTGIIRLRREV